MTQVPYAQGAIAGFGDANCAQGYGEGNVYGAGGSGTGWVGATQLMSFKDFVTNLDSRTLTHADCLLYDPDHANTYGLPSTLDFYDSSGHGCTYVNDSTTGINPLQPFGQAPHMIDFAIY